MGDDIEPPEVNTANEYLFSSGQSLSNSSLARRGRAKYIIPAFPIGPLRTKQAAYRLAAWIKVMAETHGLAEEEGAHTFSEIEAAIRNS
jgi:hypothetical protein